MDDRHEDQAPDLSDQAEIADRMGVMLTFKQAYNLWHGASCALDAGILAQRGNHDPHCEEEIRAIVQELDQPFQDLGLKAAALAEAFREAKQKGPEHQPSQQNMN